MIQDVDIAVTCDIIGCNSRFVLYSRSALKDNTQYMEYHLTQRGWKVLGNG